MTLSVTVRSAATSRKKPPRTSSGCSADACSAPCRPTISTPIGDPLSCRGIKIRYIGRMPLKRLTTPEDIRRTVMSLAAQMTAVTGVIIPIDAGRLSTVFAQRAAELIT
jgi:NAD(P)-dependent dehydrogenase (short-subunit alcohol dehydrogenase family)